MGSCSAHKPFSTNSRLSNNSTSSLLCTSEASAQSVPVVATQTLGLAALAWAGLRLKGAQFSEERLFLAVGLTALVLAGQAVNVGVAAHHSGHFMGATLLTLLLGPAEP